MCVQGVRDVFILTIFSIAQKPFTIERDYMQTKQYNTFMVSTPIL